MSDAFKKLDNTIDEFFDILENHCAKCKVRKCKGCTYDTRKRKLDNDYRANIPNIKGLKQ